MGAIACVGEVARRLPAPEEATRLRVPAHDRAPAAAHEHAGRRAARAQRRGARDPRFLPAARLPAPARADHHGVGRRGRRPDVPGDDARPERAAARRGRARRLRARLLRPRDLPHRLRPARGRDRGAGPDPGLHLRPHLPRRELEHQPPPGRVLDGRARDGLLRPGRRHAGRRGLPQVGDPRRAGSLPRGHGVLRSAHRRHGARDAAPRDRGALREHDLHRGRGAAAAQRQELRVPGRVGPGSPERARALARRGARAAAA